MNPIRPMPDVALDRAASARTLDRVGMAGIALPVRTRSATGEAMQVPARVDVHVDLRDPHARGIHMSRLYLRLQHAFAAEEMTPAGLARVLEALVETQAGLAGTGQLVIRFDHLLLRPALASANAGWKAYPVEVDAQLADGELMLSLGVAVDYSSTCPASAALSRQMASEAFARQFGADGDIPAAAARDWLHSEAGLVATPHAQRSRAEVRVRLADGLTALPIADLIDRVELALGTPVQTAVKREDEQAFAALNARNLMFCEDAARRVAHALSMDPHVRRFEARVAHFESLHAHDAVASVAGEGGAP
ncbi:GTP cyclohydrolase FolE2 [Cognatilysobacter segetis]|uniref:GTP cyclohydrolase FolE2 n=1 Tax=Cognatilysobacter segetis TaxID=2492394 RepID=UPI00192E71A0|nr:GTP cyclohydrolase FolE2 [Lysobacter segetis]